MKTGPNCHNNCCFLLSAPRLTLLVQDYFIVAASRFGTRFRIPVDYALTTDFSGSIRKVQMSAPLSNIPAVTKKGAIQEPL
jgi:hypothetical protein